MNTVSILQEEIAQPRKAKSMIMNDAMSLNSDKHYVRSQGGKVASVKPGIEAGAVGGEGVEEEVRVGDK